MLRMVGEIGSPALRACLDAPLVAKYEKTPMAEDVRALADAGYDGYIGYELCHPLPLVNGETVRIDFVDRNAKMAAAFMRKLVRPAVMFGAG